MKIISKSTLPPGGWAYIQPETKMKFDPMVSFNEQVGIIVKHRKANSLPGADPVTATEDLTRFNCLRLPSICVDESEGSKKKPGPHPSHAGVAASARQRAESAAVTITSWLGDGGKPVPKELALERASICAACPYNAEAKLFDLSKPAAATIKALLALKGTMNLTTPLDDKLGVCQICGCNLPLKVHTPIKNVLAGTDQDILKLFPDGICWIRSESEQPQPQNQAQ